MKCLPGSYVDPGFMVQADGYEEAELPGTGTVLWYDASPCENLSVELCPQLSPYPCPFSESCHYGLLLHSTPISCFCKFYFVT